MSLFSGQRRRMLASQGHDPCIICIDITALIGLSPLCAAAPWCPWARCLALQTTQVFAGPGVRYQGVLCLARPPGGLASPGLCRLVRPYQAGLDIPLTISILEVWGHGCR